MQQMSWTRQSIHHGIFLKRVLSRPTSTSTNTIANQTRGTSGTERHPTGAVATREFLKELVSLTQQ